MKPEMAGSNRTVMSAAPVERSWATARLGARAFMTTSWDDGHPLDLRVAELLAKHGLTGTFYVPRVSERGTMHIAELRRLACAFEVGGHTLDHVVLTELSEERAREEIAGSKRWLEDCVGASCALFCPPKGRFRYRHMDLIGEAGYVGLRSVEMASLDFPRRQASLWVMPTSVQVFPEPRALDFMRNAVKRGSLSNFWRFVLHGRNGDWLEMAASLLHRSVRCGGVFHLWGHSWELVSEDQWQRLDRILEMMAEVAAVVPPMTNGELCRRSEADLAGRLARISQDRSAPMSSVTGGP